MRRVDLIDDERAPARGDVPQAGDQDERAAGDQDGADQKAPHAAGNAPQPSVGRAPFRLLHLQEISSKISRSGCAGPAETQGFRGEWGLLRTCAFAACSKIAAASHCFRLDPGRRPHDEQHPAIGLWAIYRRCSGNTCQGMRPTSVQPGDARGLAVLLPIS